jgi:kinetochore protein Nuf2
MERRPPQAYLVPSMETKMISGYLSEVGFQITPADIEKPVPQYIQKLYEGVLEVFTEERVEDLTRESDFCEEALCIGVVYRRMKAFLERIGMYDFRLRDIISPERKRTVSILSCVVNFSFFKDDKRPICESIAQRKFKLESALAEAAEHVERKEREREMKRREARERAEAADRLAGEISLKEAELLRVHKKQQALTNAIEEAKREHSVCSEKISNEKYKVLATKQEVAQLRSRIVKNPEELRDLLRQMKRTAATEEGLNVQYEARDRGLAEKLSRFREEALSLKRTICDLATYNEKKAECERGEESLSRYIQENRGLEEEIECAEAKRASLEKKLAYIKSKLDAITSGESAGMRGMRERFDELKRQHEAIAREKETVSESLLKNNAAIKAMECDIVQIRSEHEEGLAALHSKILTLRERFISYRSDILASLGN